MKLPYNILAKSLVYLLLILLSVSLFAGCSYFLDGFASPTTDLDHTDESSMLDECNHELQSEILQESTYELNGFVLYSCKYCNYSFIEQLPKAEPLPTETSESNSVEILFRDIPWDATSKDAIELIENSSNSAYAFAIDNSFIQYPSVMIDPNSVYGIFNGGTIVYSSNLKAGGYDIQTAQLHFAYSVHDGIVDRDTNTFYGAFYQFDVIEHEAVYFDLKQKLTELYGQGEEEIKTESGWVATTGYSGRYEYTFTQITWHGKNDTFATLQLTSSNTPAESIQASCGVALLYGKEDANALLDNLQKALDEEKANTDRQNAVGNTDGL